MTRAGHEIVALALRHSVQIPVERSDWGALQFVIAIADRTPAQAPLFCSTAQRRCHTCRDEHYHQIVARLRFVGA